MPVTPITPAQIDTLAKLAEISPVGSEEIAAALFESDNPGNDHLSWSEWLAYVGKHGTSTTLWKEINDCRRRAEVVLTLMSEARKQGQRDVLGASSETTGLSPIGHAPTGHEPAAVDPSRGPADLVSYLHRQWAWSKETFGPALRTKGIVQHITKELREIEADPHDLAEWVDVIILAMDGFWRHGGKPEDLLPVMQAKQDKNFARQWPDWRTMGEDQAIEHDRSRETRAPAFAATIPSSGHVYIQAISTGRYWKAYGDGVTVSKSDAYRFTLDEAKKFVSYDDAVLQVVPVEALGTEAEGQDAASGLVHEGPADSSATPSTPPPPSPRKGQEENPCHWGGGNDVIWCSTCGAEYAYAKGEERPACPRQAPVTGQEENPCPMTVEEAREIIEFLGWYSNHPQRYADLCRELGKHARASEIKLALSTIRASEEDR